MQVKCATKLVSIRSDRCAGVKVRFKLEFYDFIKIRLCTYTQTKIISKLVPLQYSTAEMLHFSLDQIAHTLVM